MALSDYVRTIKANSSKWMKSLGTEYANFSWQEGYGAFSVSESMKDAVINYIKHQKEHHQRRSANDEFAHFLERNGLLSDFVSRK